MAGEDIRIDVGILDIQAAVTGSGTWVLASPLAQIRINEPLTSNLTGTVLIQCGWLKCNQGFYTSGDLLMTGGWIEVASGKGASFD